MLWKASFDNSFMFNFQIDLLLDAEKTLPGSIRQMFTAKDQVIYPNRKKRWFSALKQSENFMKALDEALKAEKVCIINLIRFFNLELEVMVCF